MFRIVIIIFIFTVSSAYAQTTETAIPIDGGPQSNVGVATDTTSEPVIGIQKRTRLMIQGSSSDIPASVPVSPKSFPDRESFFAFTVRELGATLIRNKNGAVVGAQGTYVQRGALTFNDNGCGSFRTTLSLEKTKS